MLNVVFNPPSSVVSKANTFVLAVAALAAFAAAVEDAFVLVLVVLLDSSTPSLNSEEDMETAAEDVSSRSAGIGVARTRYWTERSVKSVQRKTAEESECE